VVDPVNGVDTAANGSGMVGGQTNGICAFKTIGYALLHLGSATTVDVLPTGPVSVAGNGETFPIDVTEPGVTITGSVGNVTVNDVAAGNGGTVGTDTGTAFFLDAAGVGLSNLIIDGAVAGAEGGTATAIHGVIVTGNSTLTSTLSNVEIRNFTQSGIRVQDGGAITIDPGTNSHGNQNGLFVTGSGTAVVTGSASGPPIQFSTNTEDGIHVDTQGSVTITGSGAGGSVLAQGNSLDGVLIEQSNQTNLNTITGLLSKDNARDGLRILANSAVQVRGSVFLGNVHGVDIEESTFGATLGQDNDVSGIDLGTDTTGAGAGGNDLQDPASPNTGAGLCLNILANRAETLSAEGNQWQSKAATPVAVDCTMTASTLSIAALAAGHRGCDNGVDIGGQGLGGSASVNANGIAVDECGCGGGTAGTATTCE